jgi:hypothetical protein
MAAAPPPASPADDAILDAVRALQQALLGRTGEPPYHTAAAKTPDPDRGAIGVSAVRNTVRAPEFDGSHPTRWLNAIQLFFHGAAITEEEDRVRLAVSHFRGPTAEWALRHIYVGSWSEFVSQFKEEYCRTTDVFRHQADVIRRLSHLKQNNTSAREYSHAFLEILGGCALDDSVTVCYYLNGLRPDVLTHTVVQNPQTLRAAIATSVDIDNALASVAALRAEARSQTQPVHAQRQRVPAPPGAARAAAATRMPGMSAAQRADAIAKGLCFLCGQHGHIKSQCPASRSAAGTGGGGEGRRQGGNSAAPSGSGAASFRR